MPPSFLGLPGEVRNNIYESCLCHDKPVVPYFNYSQDEELAIGLLRTNKTVHAEASAIFYSQNRFDFTFTRPWAKSEAVALFLNKLGRSNADNIQRIHVSFPRFGTDTDSVNIFQQDVSIFETIQRCCANIKIMTISARGFNQMMYDLYCLENTNHVTQALISVDRVLRANLALQEIIVKVPNDDLSDLDESIRSRMENLGWTLSKEGAMEDLVVVDELPDSDEERAIRFGYQDSNHDEQSWSDRRKWASHGL